MVALSAVLLLVGCAPTDEQARGPASDGAGTSEASAVRFEDLGDGTALDHSTGLIWEIKVEGLRCGHCVDDKHTWSAGGDDPDGTVFTEFLDTLNGRCDSDERTPCSSNADCAGIGSGLCGHAGHRDWRLPTRDELQSLLLEPFECGTSPCIHPSFPGPTKPSGYWTSRSSQSQPHKAYGVFFSNGFVGRGPKRGPAFVRAVRSPDDG